MMRKWIDLLETAFDHPHLRGEDELFQFLYRYTINVDLARRLIASGEINPVDYDMPIERGGQMLLNMSPSEFGSNDFENPKSIDLLATAVNRKALPQIPEEKFSQPLLMMMWNSKLADPELNHNMEDRAIPVLVDGNHRLAKRYLSGDTGSMKCWVIRDWDDVAKITERDGKPLGV